MEKNLWQYIVASEREQHISLLLTDTVLKADADGFQRLFFQCVFLSWTHPQPSIPRTRNASSVAPPSIRFLVDDTDPPLRTLHSPLLLAPLSLLASAQGILCWQFLAIKKVPNVHDKYFLPAIRNEQYLKSQPEALKIHPLIDFSY